MCQTGNRARAHSSCSLFHIPACYKNNTQAHTDTPTHIHRHIPILRSRMHGYLKSAIRFSSTRNTCPRTCSPCASASTVSTTPPSPFGRKASGTDTATPDGSSVGLTRAVGVEECCGEGDLPWAAGGMCVGAGVGDVLPDLSGEARPTVMVGCGAGATGGTASARPAEVWGKTSNGVGGGEGR